MNKLCLALFFVLVSCGELEQEDLGDAATPALDAEGTAPDAGTADASTADAAPMDGSEADAGTASCEGHPICNAFRNNGAFGGSVTVMLNTANTEAVVFTNSIPAYEPGPYGRNPNMAEEQMFIFRIPLTPTVGPAAAGLGHVAIAWNGVSMFNSTDARRIGGCTGNAAYIEGDQVDPFGGHPTMNGEYHYHSGAFLGHAAELGLEHRSDAHSSLVGYAFDGIPIYGPYGFSSPMDPSSPIKELKSCYRLKAARSCCTDPNVCAVTSMFQNKVLILGAFVEDFEFDPAALAQGSCDLDEYNSRVAVTPEYPNGTRVYAMTFDQDGMVAFPFIFGTRYWGSPIPQR